MESNVIDCLVSSSFYSYLCWQFFRFSYFSFFLLITCSYFRWRVLFSKALALSFVLAVAMQAVLLFYIKVSVIFTQIYFCARYISGIYISLPNIY